jgi:hypothetical protein
MHKMEEDVTVPPSKIRYLFRVWKSGADVQVEWYVYLFILV